MRERIANLFVKLAFVLILGDAVWSLRRLAPYLADAVRRSPEAAMLAVALGLLVAAQWVRAGRGRAEPGAEDGEGRQW